MRLNTLKTDETTILQTLAKEAVKVEKIEQLKSTYRILQTKTPLTKTESYKQGLFYIQDKASCFAAEAADPKPETTVLDVCAAPGAKTTYLAQLMQNNGIIYSLDYSRRRMSVWKNETRHMGVGIAEPIIADACRLLPFQIEADLVILDPPCTSTGTFGRLPSSKWRLTPRSIDRMAGIQWRMLDNCANYVKQEGKLVYSTCSITVEENEMQIERFLKHHPDFSLAPITPKIGVPGMRGLNECQRLYSHLHQCNGFFIAKLQKE
jgi:16S rRNA (cytosine967-C5)-methyltransferase